MSNILLLLADYIHILFLLGAVCLMTLIFIRSNKKEVKMIWLGRALVLFFLFFVSVLNMFITFTYDIRTMYNFELISSITQFTALISSILFIVFILFKKQFLKYI